MADVSLTCACCGKSFTHTASHVNRQRRNAGPSVRFFCSMKCCGAARRIEVPKEVRVQRKAEYDREYRKRLGALLRQKKREYHRRTYDRAKAAEYRKQRAAWHVEYCRRYYSDPKRKAEKVKYDEQRRDASYGEWGEAVRVLIQLEKRIRQQVPSKYERAKARGYYDNQRTTTERKRIYGQSHK